MVRFRQQRSVPGFLIIPVPGSSQRMLEKSRGIVADCVAYDLEDSVTPSKKAEARAQVRNLLGQPRAVGIKEQAVRINAVQTGIALDDLTEVVRNSKRRYIGSFEIDKYSSKRPILTL